MSKIQKLLCIFLCACLLGTALCPFFVQPGNPFRPEDFWRLLPLWKYVEESGRPTDVREDPWTAEQLIENNQTYIQEAAARENQAARTAEEKSAKENAPQTAVQETEPIVQAPALTPHPELDLSIEKLSDPEYLLEHFFIKDPNASLDEVRLDAQEFLKADMTLSDGAGPQILIYHSHSQEEFADTVPGDTDTTIIGVGGYLAKLLQEQYGYQVLHLTDTFDIVNGEIDRSRAYDFAREKVAQVLEENPSIQVVIDLHRDGVAENRRLVTEINGKQTAQIMCFNGLSSTAKNGPVDYLPNPYIQENLAFSFQLEMQAAQYYPSLYRGIYLAGLRYNLHLCPKALLLEAGAQTNTVEEVKNAMEPFADILHRVLSGEGSQKE